VYFEVQSIFFRFLFFLRLFLLGFSFFWFLRRRFLTVGVSVEFGCGISIGIFLMFVLRVLPPLPLEVTQFITVVRMLYLEHGVCVGTCLPQNGFECAVQLGSPLLERIFTGILAWVSLILC